MQEVDFNYVIDRLEKEIKSLEEGIANAHDNDTSLCRTLATFVLHDKRELLGLIKESVRTERDKIQSAMDSIDATMLAYMAHAHSSDKWFTEDFYKALNHAKENMPHPPPMPTAHSGNLDASTSSKCWDMARRLQDLRIHLKSQMCETNQNKLLQIRTESILEDAVKLLRECGKIIEGF